MDSLVFGNSLLYHHFFSYRGNIRGILIDRKHQIAVVAKRQSMEVLLYILYNI